MIASGPFRGFNKSIPLLSRHEFARKSHVKALRREASAPRAEFAARLIVASTKAAHTAYGQQLWVSQEVSDDLLHTQLDDVDFDTLPWPADFLEVCFEDPQIPSTLMQRYSRPAFLERLEKDAGIDAKWWETASIISSTPADELTFLSLVHVRGYSVVVTGPGTRMNSFATAGDLYVRGDCFEDEGIDKKDADKKNQRLLNLTYKVLLYASSEGNAPRATLEKPTKKQGGKPGFNGRPKTARLIVEYLPHQRSERQKQAAEAKGKNQFNGRRGHFRVYRAERYKAMRNKRMFIYPIPGPDGTVPDRRKEFRVV